MAGIYDLCNIFLDQRKVRGSDPLLWSGWLSSSSTATPNNRYTYIDTIQYSVPNCFRNYHGDFSFDNENLTCLNLQSELSVKDLRTKPNCKTLASLLSKCRLI